jgi:hypothetical protein
MVLPFFYAINVSACVSPAAASLGIKRRLFRRSNVRFIHSPMAPSRSLVAVTVIVSSATQGVTPANRAHRPVVESKCHITVSRVREAIADPTTGRPCRPGPDLLAPSTTQRGRAWAEQPDVQSVARQCRPRYFPSPLGPQLQVQGVAPSINGVESQRRSLTGHELVQDRPGTKEDILNLATFPRCPTLDG